MPHVMETSRLRILLLVFLSGVTLLLGSCGERTHGDTSLSERAVAIWKHHEDVLERAVKGESWDSDELLEAN